MAKKSNDAEIKRLEKIVEEQAKAVTEKDRAIKVLQERLDAVPAHVTHGIILGINGPRVYGNKEAIEKVKEIIEKAKPKKRKAAPVVPPMDDAGDVD